MNDPKCDVCGEAKPPLYGKPNTENPSGLVCIDCAKEVCDKQTGISFNFPAIKLPPDYSLFQQALKIISESDEMMAELSDDPPSQKFDLEAMDLYHALETYFRMQKPEYVEKLKEKTEIKNMERGYYDK